MAEIETGGQAFPRPMAETSIGGNIDQEGMTLRDYFAGQALAGRNVQRIYKSWSDMATDCYEVADAMLLARSRPRE